VPANACAAGEQIFLTWQTLRAAAITCRQRKEPAAETLADRTLIANCSPRENPLRPNLEFSGTALSGQGRL